MLDRRLIRISFAAALLGAAPAAAVSFTPLGDLAGGVDFYSQALGLSADGTVAAGVSHGANGTEGVRFDGSLAGTGDLLLGIFDSRATGASADGSLLSGTGNSTTGSEAFLYDEGSGTLTPLGALIPGGQSSANGISGDGLVVVGTADSATGDQAFRWQGTMLGLGSLAVGGESQGLAVSADGLVVVGGSDSASGPQAFRWEGGAMLGLGDLAGGAFESTAFGVSPDGSLVVGRSETGSADEAFLWSSGAGMQGLGDLEGLGLESTAFDVTDAGVAVGTSATTTGFSEAVLWSAPGSPSAILDILVNNGLAAELTGWSLVEARAISDDGRTIAGWGFNPDGDTEGWIATIPEPSTALLLALGLALLARRTGRSG